jgi:Fe-S oxidoreductase
VEKQLTPKRVGYTTSSMTGSMATSARTRQLVPGSDVRTVDSGCGGMAGLFGYEEDHYEVSMKMGERRLFPTVREAEGRVIVAPGTSCREQILDGTGGRALHPAEYLAARLNGD